jgi:hypothetical protein
MELHDDFVTGWLKARSRSALFLALVTLGATAGCGGGEAETSTYGPPTECDAGPELCTGNTGIGAGSSSGGGDGGLQGVDVTGTVQRLAERSFTISQDFLGAATVIASGVDGTDVLAAYNGQLSPTFMMTDVAAGDRWFFVRDDSAGASGIYSTYSFRRLPDPATISLAVIDTQVLADIGTTLPVAVAVDSGKAQVILKFSRNGLPLSGVTLGTDLSTLADIAYDEGSGGVYSNQTTATGSGGTILLLNMNSVPNGEFLNVTFLDATQQAFPTIFPIAANAATIVSFEL